MTGDAQSAETVRVCPNCKQPTMPVYAHQDTERGGWRCAPIDGDERQV